MSISSDSTLPIAMNIDEVDFYFETHNRIRPHEALNFGVPIDTYLSEPSKT